MAIGTATALIGSALIGGATSAMGNKAQSDATKSAVNAQTQASAQQIQLAKEQRDLAMQILAPYVKDGQQADAYLNALMYGEGSYGGSAGTPGTSSGGVPNYQAFFDRYHDVRDAWNNNVGHVRQAFGNDPQRFMAHFWTNMEDGSHPWDAGSTGGTPGTEATRVTRDQVMELIRQSPLYQQADEDFRNRLEEADRAYQEERDLSQAELNQLNSLSAEERTRLLGMSADQRAKMLSLSADERARLLSLNTEERNRRLQLGEDQKTRDLVTTLNDWNARKSYTDTAIAKREDLTNLYQKQSVDRMAATIGTTGQVGRAQRAADERANQYSLEFADTERGWRGDDLDHRTAGVRNAWDKYYGTAQDTEGKYYDLTRGAEGNFYGDSRDAEYDYYGNNRDAEGGYYDDAEGNYQNYYGRSREAMRGRNATRQSAYDTRAGGRTAAYSDYTAALEGRSTRGYGAATGQASAGQTYAGAASDATGAGARAYAEGQYQLGQNRADMWADAGSYAADAVGAISNRTKPKTKSYSTYTY